VYVAAHQAERDAQGHALVVRNGHSRARTVTIGAGTITVQAPRVDDRRVDEAGERRRFHSRSLPPYRRRSPKVAEVLPILSLRGLSTGDFCEALPVLLGAAAAGRSPTTITRLTAAWEAEYQAFQQRDLRACDDVYIWVDGMHFNIRLEDERRCTLVVIGARADGSKAVIAGEDGDRESPESWLSFWRGLKRRGWRRLRWRWATAP
jgi:putative transposase